MTIGGLYSYLQSICGLQIISLAAEDAQTEILVSNDYAQADKLIVFVNDSGSLGVWREGNSYQADDINHPFSMLPYLKYFIIEKGYRAIVCNPYTNGTNPNDHLASVWNQLICSQTSCKVDFIVAGEGGKAVFHLLSQFEQSCYERLRRIAFLQSTHALTDENSSPKALETLGRRSVNWLGAIDKPLGSQFIPLQDRVGCVCLSTGFISPNPSHSSEIYPIELSPEHLEHMKYVIFLFVSSNPPNPRMTAIVKDIRRILREHNEE
ncbi:RAC family serine/threonine-protein kinase [Thraustotheca clavata]|uniref:RAC family serine/threonine-protein kinase n=1 Tax=Thraustotheca clavata TaxID=74557 RepID=A0A1V9ZE71_9STRA|nr:RAC family serine/threonine-protein kinase [Thraustotheca clavata]